MYGGILYMVDFFYRCGLLAVFLTEIFFLEFSLILVGLYHIRERIVTRMYSNNPDIYKLISDTQSMTSVIRM